MKKKLIISLLSALPFGLFAQGNSSPNYDISKDKVLYVVAYSHLDSEWNWDYPTTINECIRNIMTENFHLFEKYPNYVYNFTGSRRYQMMKEYYPDLYEKVKKYIDQGRWKVSGSSVDEGEVNMSSSESIIRQVLYGNRFFNQEFGKVSQDYILPDCFGFLANLPSIWNHCGLLGFSTQKLTWRSANGVPFNVGVWNGPDGKGVVAALNATSYSGGVVPRLDLDEGWNKRIEENKAKYGTPFDFRYFGVGDMGGAPRERDVKNTLGSMGNPDSKFKVLLTSSDQIYKDITPEIRKKLPVYSGDLLLIEHSAGSLTSQSYLKRQNRKNELLAQAAEQTASIADWMGVAKYPFTKLNNSWNLVLGSQFHDILPGTSIPKAYEYAWNDEFIAANGFSNVLKHAVGSVSGLLDTRSEGRAITVYNPVAKDRDDIVTAEMEYEQQPTDLAVFNKDGKKVASQIIGRKDNKVQFIFQGHVPSVGMAVYYVKQVDQKQATASALKVTDRTLENEFYIVKLASNGDITSVFDKKASKELLSSPARLEFQQEQPREWPAWNMDWKDRQKPAIDVMDKDAQISIVENGPVRVSLKVTRKGRNSEITQVISLSAGEAGKRVEVKNKLDWQSREVCLKASFPLAVSNKEATYNLGVGTIKRTNNNEVKFEVPSKEWFDLTDQSGKYGVSILEDCKYGSDKPSNNTLRLTLVYTPNADAFNKSYIYQNTQDFGIHDFKYAIYGHKDGWEKAQSSWQGKFFNQPLLAFETPAHNGSMGKEVSLLKISSPQVGLMAFKKMEQGDYYLVRVNELIGRDAKGVKVSFPGKVVDAYEVNGQEQKIGNADFKDGSLNMDITHYTIRSYAVKLQAQSQSASENEQASVVLPFNQDVMSFDDNRHDGDFYHNHSLPSELVPNEIVSEDVHFKMGSSADGDNNAVSCRGQVIDLPQGDYDKLYVLAAADDDVKGTFKVDGSDFNLTIQKWTGYVGQFFNRSFTPDMANVTAIAEPFAKQGNIAWFASHSHDAYPSKNEAYQYTYLYKYAIAIPNGAKKLTLPQNSAIKVLAVTLGKQSAENVKSLQSLSDNFDGDYSIRLRNAEQGK
ncbi:MAG: glycoside hydrolase family 38 C-terminal domain-containing protein [Bacteroidota bacterium]|nr:glycoside hydrolase family 38 C-terminal domain-containing protein [Bacteroidota bacterium]